MNTPKILLVDDEEDILEFIGYNLKKEGYDVYLTQSSSEALKLASEIIPDLILLDVMMPEMDGIETCAELRKNPKLNQTLIAILSARNEDYSQVAGLDAGADDYITKPIKPRLLISRVKAILRRKPNTSEEAEKESVVGNIVLNRESYTIINKGEEFNLPKKEFELLSLLMSKPGKVFTRDTILEKIWGGDVIVGDRTIDVHIRKLREKVGSETIKTIKGVGYKFVE